MTDHYVAWDGRRYAGAPPAGWYLASDGRWWAPNSGPEATSGQSGADSTPYAGTSGQVLKVSARPDPAETKRVAAITGVTLFAVIAGLLVLASIGRSNNSSADQPNGTTTTVAATGSAAQAAEFRTFLAERSFPIDPSTSDAQLETFGQATCNLAEDEKPSSWDAVLEVEARELVSKQSGASSATETDYQNFLNGSLLVYCPDEAARLGVTR